MLCTRIEFVNVVLEFSIRYVLMYEREGVERKEPTFLSQSTARYFP